MKNMICDGGSVSTGISTTKDTKDRLKQLANDKHMSISGLITYWVWNNKTAAEEAAASGQAEKAGDGNGRN